LAHIDALAQAEQWLECRYVITNYDTVRLHWRWFQKHHWYHVIVDEAHNIKTPTALRTRVVKAPNAYARIALSGTPIYNRPNDLWSLLHFLEPGPGYPHKYRSYRRNGTTQEDKIPTGLQLRKDSPKWGSYHAFTERYCIKNRYGGVVRGKNLDELHQRTQRVMIRWRDEEVNKDLPELRPPLLINIDLTLAQQKLYHDMRQGFFRWIERQEHLRSALQQPTQYVKEIRTVLAQLTYFRRIVSMSPRTFARAMAAKDRPEFAVDVQIPDTLESAKAAWVQDFIEGQLEDDEKVVILSNWTDTLRELAKLLAKYEPVIVAGDVSARDRQDAVENFKKVFLGSPAAFEGINLQAANNLIWMELPWTATQVTQGNGRIHRIGQTRPCNVFVLLARNTIDERVLLVNQQKASDIAQAVDGGFTSELLQFGLKNLV
jgi:SNF2 family DNA or RNA helicase